jgi:hypothetical protein
VLVMAEKIVTLGTTVETVVLVGADKDMPEVVCEIAVLVIADECTKEEEEEEEEEEEVEEEEEEVSEAFSLVVVRDTLPALAIVDGETNAVKGDEVNRLDTPVELPMLAPLSLFQLDTSSMLAMEDLSSCSEKPSSPKKMPSLKESLEQGQSTNMSTDDAAT